eukprot:Sspe_Gene.84084::Locus_55188_Transcript_3_3_Confidence_0.667_Length_1424::g.84084::m.84084
MVPSKYTPSRRATRLLQKILSDKDTGGGGGLHDIAPLPPVVVAGRQQLGKNEEKTTKSPPKSFGGILRILRKRYLDGGLSTQQSAIQLMRLYHIIRDDRLTGLPMEGWGCFHLCADTVRRRGLHHMKPWVLAYQLVVARGVLLHLGGDMFRIAATLFSAVDEELCQREGAFPCATPKEASILLCNLMWWKVAGGVVQYPLLSESVKRMGVGGWSAAALSEWVVLTGDVDTVLEGLEVEGWRFTEVERWRVIRALASRGVPPPRNEVPSHPIAVADLVLALTSINGTLPSKLLRAAAVHLHPTTPMKSLVALGKGLRSYREDHPLIAKLRRAVVLRKFDERDLNDAVKVLILVKKGKGKVLRWLVAGTKRTGWGAASDKSLSLFSKSRGATEELARRCSVTAQ